MDPLLALFLGMAFGSSIVAAYGLGRVRGIVHAERVLVDLRAELEATAAAAPAGWDRYVYGGRSIIGEALSRLER